jgi:hypothetical protein
VWWPEEVEAQRSARNAVLRRLVETGILRSDAPFDADIQADVSEGILRVQSRARMLRIGEEA